MALLHIFICSDGQEPKSIWPHMGGYTGKNSSIYSAWQNNVKAALLTCDSMCLYFDAMREILKLDELQEIL